MSDDELRRLLEEVRDELRKARQQGLVVRLPDAQIEDIAYRVLERVDERLAAGDPAPDTAPRPAQRPSRFHLPGRP